MAGTFDVDSGWLSGLARSQGVRDVLAKAARVGAESARRRCPVSNDNTPGHVHLRDTIYADVDGEVIRFGAKKDYTVYVEFGTRRMAAQPFLRPAIADIKKVLR